MSDHQKQYIIWFVLLHLVSIHLLKYQLLFFLITLNQSLVWYADTKSSTRRNFGFVAKVSSNSNLSMGTKVSVKRLPLTAFASNLLSSLIASIDCKQDEAAYEHNASLSSITYTVSWHLFSIFSAFSSSTHWESLFFCASSLSKSI